MKKKEGDYTAQFDYVLNLEHHTDLFTQPLDFVYVKTAEPSNKNKLYIKYDVRLISLKKRIPLNQ